VSRGNAGVVQRADLEADAATPVDYRFVFEQTAPACLLLRPDVPRFSVAAASRAFIEPPRAAPEHAGGPCLNDVLAASGVALADRTRRTLHAALERAARSGASARLSLEAPGAAPSGQTPALGPFFEAVVTPISRDGAVYLVALRLEGAGGGAAGTEPGESLAAALAARTLELEGARRDLANARAELEAFGYSVSHDLRAPLRAIDGFALALSQDCGETLDERARHYLERVQAGARRMSSLLDDLLELSRIQLAPLERAHVNVSELARRVAASLAAADPERLSLAVHVEDGLEACADPRLVELLLGKLLDNARKFTSRRPNASVRVGRDASSGSTTLFVADDGVGFDMAYAKRLFSPFQRLHRAADYPGNGIGLAIARRIVSRHGGRIWAQAEPERGACFRFRLGEGEAGD